MVVLMKRYLLLPCLCLLVLTITLISCGEVPSDQKPIKYPDSIYGQNKAEFGRGYRFN
jgi:hypothetical protein